MLDYVEEKDNRIVEGNVNYQKCNLSYLLRRNLIK